MNLPIRRYKLHVKDSETIDADVQLVDPRRVVVLVCNHTKTNAHSYTTGPMLVRNRRMAEESANGTSWSVSRCAYSCWRGQIMIDRNAGGPDEVQDGELQKLLADSRGVQAYVRSLFASGSLGHAEESDLEIILAAICTQLATKRDRRKVIAEINFARALQLVDSLGRHNPAAAAMAAGAGIGRLQDREEQLRAILAYVSMRAFRIHRLIEDIRWRYKCLLDDLGGRCGSVRGRLMEMAYRPTVERMALTCRVLREYREAFSHVYAHPFLNNARHLAKDLDEALNVAAYLADNGDAVRVRDLRGVYARMHQGIRWMNALHHLELYVMTPLSLLMEDAKRDGRVQKEAVGAPRHERITIERSFAPKQFTSIVEALRFFHRAAKRCPDHRLHNRVRKSVLVHVEEALEFTGQDDWLEVKASLRNVTDILSGQV